MSRYLFVFLICASSITSALTNQKIQKLAEDLEKTKKNLVEDEEKQRVVMSSLFEINRKMRKIVTDRGNMVQERMVLESTTKELASKILELETKLKEQKSWMRERLVAIYKLGGQGIARILFSSKSSAQLERNLKILGIVAKRDLDLIKNYSETVQDLEIKKSKFVKRLAKIKKLENKIKEQEGRLAVENTSKNKILEKIRQSKKYSLTKLSGIREKTTQISEQDDTGVLDLLFRPSFFEKKGTLISPVQGLIVQNFGIVRDEEFNVSWPHKGIFYSAPEGQPIKSVFEGIVSFVGDVPGFGTTVIVDHADHYYTVYGFTKNIKVKLGDEIKSNQEIAVTGFAKEQNLSGLYFEIRHFSEPYDPTTWLKGNTL